MKYVKQHFVTGMKVSLPDVLNRMEDGIAAACGAAVEGIGTVMLTCVLGASSGTGTASSA